MTGMTVSAKENKKETVGNPLDPGLTYSTVMVHGPLEQYSFHSGRMFLVITGDVAYCPSRQSTVAPCTVEPGTVGAAEPASCLPRGHHAFESRHEVAILRRL